MSKGLCRCIAFVLALVGVYFIIWEVANSQYDEYLAYGIILCAISALLFYQGFRKPTVPERSFPKKPLCTNHPEYESISECEVCGNPFCEECLTKIYGKYYCEKCKDPFLQKISQVPLKSRTIALLLCLFLGVAGIHRIYLGDNSGSFFLVLHIIFLPLSILVYIPLLIYIPILIVLCIMSLIDLIHIASGQTTDTYGRDLV